MTIGLEVDANVKCECSMVAMFHASLGTKDVALSDSLHGLLRRCAVCICGLHKAKTKLSIELRILKELRCKLCQKQRHSISVEQPEAGISATKEVYDPVCIAIKAHTS